MIINMILSALVIIAITAYVAYSIGYNAATKAYLPRLDFFKERFADLVSELNNLRYEISVAKKNNTRNTTEVTNHNKPE